MRHTACLPILLCLHALPAQKPPDLGAFAFRLLRAADVEGNACLSPWSLALALGMARAGAAGSTAAQIDEALGLEGAEVVRRLAALRTALTPEPIVEHEGGKTKRVVPYELLVANAAWALPEQEFLPAWLAILDQGFGAPLRRTDFRSDAARQTINGWVAAQTKDRIPELFGPGQPSRQTRLVLVNCVYLNAPWAKPFAEGRTRPADFHLPGGSTASVATMQQTASFPYTATEHAHVLDLPFRGGGLALRLVVPKEVDGIERAEAEVAKSWPMREALTYQEVELHLPRFQLEQSYRLVDALAKLGIEDAFDEKRADFSKMTGGRELFVTDVVQKTFVKVDEKSTEAAAATGVAVGVTSVPAEPVVVRADRPFLFVIHDTHAHQVLFLGRVSDPR